MDLHILLNMSKMHKINIVKKDISIYTDIFIINKICTRLKFEYVSYKM